MQQWDVSAHIVCGVQTRTATTATTTALVDRGGTVRMAAWPVDINSLCRTPVSHRLCACPACQCMQGACMEDARRVLQGVAWHRAMPALRQNRMHGYVQLTEYFPAVVCCERHHLVHLIVREPLPLRAKRRFHLVCHYEALAVGVERTERANECVVVVTEQGCLLCHLIGLATWSHNFAKHTVQSTEDAAPT